MGIADLRQHLPRTRQISHPHEVEFVTVQRIPEHILRLPDHHLIRLPPDPGDEHRMAHGQIKSPALPDRIVRDPLMAPENLSLRRHKIPAPRHPFPGLPLDKGRVVMIRYKAYLLAVRLVGHRKPFPPGNVPYLLFRIFSYRHQRAGQLLLRQTIEGIGLVLLIRHTAAHRIPAFRRPCDPRIVARRNVVRPDPQAPPKQRLPFHIAIAGDTGIRRPACQIFVHEIVDHPALELFPEIHHVMRNVKLSGHSSGVLHRAPSAAAPVLFLLISGVLLPDLHRDPYHLIALFF